MDLSKSKDGRDHLRKLRGGIVNISGMNIHVSTLKYAPEKKKSLTDNQLAGDSQIFIARLLGIMLV